MILLLLMFFIIFFRLIKKSGLLFAKFRYSRRAKIAMNVFCCFIKEELSKKFRNEVYVFVSEKKKLVHFAFSRPLISYPFFGWNYRLCCSPMRRKKKTFLLIIKWSILFWTIVWDGKVTIFFLEKIEKSKQKHGSRKRLTSRGNV